VSTTCRVVTVMLALSLLTACHGNSKKAAVPKNRTRSTYLIPNFIPRGFKLTRATIEHPGPAADTFAAAVGRPTGAGAFDGVIRAFVVAANEERSIAPGEKASPVEINGVRARLHFDPASGASVDWFANGLAVAVTGPTGDTAIVVDVARRLRLPTPSKPADASLDAAPAGYTVIGTSHFVGHAPEAGYSLVISGPPGAVITVQVFATRVPVAFAPGLGDRVESTQVRGHDALISRRTQTVAGTARVTQSAIDWYDRQGVLVSMITNGLPEQLLPVARGLAWVSQAEWLRRVPLQES
jgi:hypothetical protein